MKLYDQNSTSSMNTMLAIAAVAAAWGLLVLVLLGWFFSPFAQRGQALVATPVVQIPIITVQPASGSVGTTVTIQGQGWPGNSLIMISLVSPVDTNLPDYAVANAIADATGQFTASFLFPQESRWNHQNVAIVVARTQESGVTAQANFNLTDSDTPPPKISALPTATGLPTQSSTPTSVPTLSPTPSPQPSATAVVVYLPTPTNTPTFPVLSSVTNLNIRSGPGAGYEIIGLLPTGQSVEITGLSYDRGWWQIRFPGVATERGWVSARYVTAHNGENIPLVQAPLLPVQPTPKPAPPVSALPPANTVGIWRAEYYNNPYLSGPPALIRTDADVNFNWGTASPATGLSSDNFSVRWTGTWAFYEGTYRFHAIVDDGVRVYVDNALVIDNWQDGSQRELTGDRWLSGGNHSVRVEYYDHTNQALIRVWIESIVPPPSNSNDNNSNDNNSNNNNGNDNNSNNNNGNDNNSNNNNGNDNNGNNNNGNDNNNNNRPEANFTVNRRSGLVPLSVEFYNNTNGNYDRCVWNFGDGSNSGDCFNVSHTYTQPGNYTVWLGVDGPDGSDVKQKTDYIRVQSPPQPPYVPADWHDVLPPDWRSKVPEQYHAAIEACLDYFNQIHRPLESPPSLNSILKDCRDYLN